MISRKQLFTKNLPLSSPMVTTPAYIFSMAGLLRKQMDSASVDAQSTQVPSKGVNKAKFKRET